MENYILENHKECHYFYKERLEKYTNWKFNQRPLTSFKAGMLIDVRD